MNLFIYILIGVLIFMLIGSLLPFVAPVLIFFLVLSLLRGFMRRKTYDETETYYSNTYDDNDYESNYTKSSPPKHDAIDVEYTEREDDGDTQ